MAHPHGPLWGLKEEDTAIPVTHDWAHIWMAGGKEAQGMGLESTNGKVR
jgi:hypothetical protein